jgi:TPR repeat protein
MFKEPQFSVTSKLTKSEVEWKKKFYLTELDRVRTEISRLKSMQTNQVQQEKEKEKELSNDEIAKRLKQLEDKNFHLERELRDLSEDKSEKIKQLQQKIALNDLDAMYVLSAIYALDQGVNKNTKEGMKLLMTAAELGHGPAMTSLAVSYQRGLDLPKDVLKAEECYMKAIALNDSRAMVLLAKLYLQQPVQKKAGKNKEVKELLERAIALNNPDAMTTLAELYIRGIVIPQDLTKAIELLKSPAQLGNSTALFMLGKLYSGINGYMSPQPVRAQYYYNKAVKLGHRQAMVNLATLLLANKNHRNIDWQIIGSLWQEAAKLGDSSACNNLGDLYNVGGYYTPYGGLVSVTKRNRSKAIEYYAKAVKLGNTKAMFSLGDLYEQKSNYSKAAKLYAKAYNQGNEYAESSLHTMSGSGKAEAAYRLALIKDNNSFSSKEKLLIDALPRMEPDKAIKRLQKCWEKGFISSDNALHVLSAVQEKASNTENKNPINFFSSKIQLAKENHSDQKKALNAEIKNAINFLFAKIYLAQRNISEAEKHLNEIEKEGIGLSADQLHELGQQYLTLFNAPEKAQLFLVAAVQAGSKGAEIELKIIDNDDATNQAQRAPDINESDESDSDEAIAARNNPLSQLRTSLIQLRRLLPTMVRGERHEVMDSAISDFLITLTKHLQLNGDSLPQHATEVNLLAQLTNVLDIYDSCSQSNSSKVSQTIKSIFSNLLYLVESEENKEKGSSVILLTIGELTDLLDQQNFKLDQMKNLLPKQNLNMLYGLPFFSKTDELEPLRQIIYDENLFAYEQLQRLEKILSHDNGSNNTLRILPELRVQLLGIITSQAEKRVATQVLQS